MHLKKGFITHNADGEQILVAAGKAAPSFHGLVRSNRTAAFIIEQLKKNITEEQILDAMAKKYDAPREVMLADVRMVVEKLRSIGAIEE